MFFRTKEAGEHDHDHGERGESDLDRRIELRDHTAGRIGSDSIQHCPDDGAGRIGDQEA